MEIWTWRHGEMKIKRNGNMETWRHGDKDMYMETWQMENGSPGDFP
jgi:hypothetical protein